jgi:hypothetical protein
MKACLVKAGLWSNETHEKALKSLLEECECSLAAKPRPRPRVSLHNTEKGEELCIDIIYFDAVPYLHAEDRYSAFSACSRLTSRLITDQIGALTEIWILPHGAPKRIAADFEYDKAEFRAFCDKIGCDLVVVATEAHHQNGTIEAGNRVLRMFYRRIRLAEKQLNQLQVVENAVYGKNCCTGTKGASSYELWFGSAPGIASLPVPLRAAYDAKQARMKIFRAIKPGHRTYDDVRVGQHVRIFRERQGWSTPCLVVSVSRNIITVIHNSRHKTAARSSVIPCDPPFAVFLDPDDCSLEPRLDTGTSEPDEYSDALPPSSNDDSSDLATEGDASADRTEMVSNSSPKEAAPSDRPREWAQNDTSVEGRAPRGQPKATLPSDRVLRSQTVSTSRSTSTHNLTATCLFPVESVEFGAIHFVTSMPFTQSSKLATSEEMADAYLKERKNWSDAGTYQMVGQLDIPRNSNIIGSHVIYKYKSDGSLKARIVSHGHMDDEKAFLRTDAPTMSVEVMRLLVSIAAERGWRPGSLDIKAAYLQAAGFDRESFVRPPKKRPIPITCDSCGSLPMDWSKVGGSGF